MENTKIEVGQEWFAKLKDDEETRTHYIFVILYKSRFRRRDYFLALKKCPLDEVAVTNFVNQCWWFNDSGEALWRPEGSEQPNGFIFKLTKLRIGRSKKAP